eukprot:TRINITY_DN30075_c0_g1_i2.p1 TRINITY_DN30075_c0_g1~~TRINITY_DN30075_c0_g1_i2.p1  ORF type:complete len:548 (+),score=132.70 TRINITY_DN30075_c0_g1_i2:70-1713(+)
MTALMPLAGGRKVISYPALEVHSVEEMMEPLRPLVRSTRQTTRGKAPSFQEEQELLKRREDILEKRVLSLQQSQVISHTTVSTRKQLKAQLEFEREKHLAQQLVYRLTKQEEFRRSHTTSPFLEDLAARHEKLVQLEQMRDEERRRAARENELKRRELRNEIIVQALTEVDDAEERRELHRQKLQSRKQEKAVNDVRKVFGEVPGSVNTTPPLVSFGATDTSAEESQNATTATELPSPIKPAGKRKPIYLLERQRELAERARLEAEQSRQRAEQALILAEMNEELARREEQERLLRKQRRLAVQQRREAEEAQKRQEIEEQRKREQEAARKRLQEEEERQQREARRKQKEAEAWRKKALGPRVPLWAPTPAQDMKPVKEYPAPPPKKAKSGKAKPEASSPLPALSEVFRTAAKADGPFFALELLNSVTNRHYGTSLCFKSLLAGPVGKNPGPAAAIPEVSVRASTPQDAVSPSASVSTKSKSKSASTPVTSPNASSSSLRRTPSKASSESLRNSQSLASPTLSTGRKLQASGEYGDDDFEPVSDSES